MSKVPAIVETKNERRERITNRSLAVLEQAFDLIESRDPAAALAAAYKKDPLSFLERVSKFVAPPSEVGKTSNINGLFVLAAKQAAQAPALPGLPIIDVEVTEAGVQSGSSPEQPIDW